MTRETLGLLLGFLGVVIFGGTLPATRAAVADLTPWFVTHGRAAGAGCIALVVLLMLQRPLPTRNLWRDFLLVSICLVIGFPGFVGKFIEPAALVERRRERPTRDIAID